MMSGQHAGGAEAQLLQNNNMVYPTGINNSMQQMPVQQMQNGGLQVMPGKNMIECPHCQKCIGFQPMMLVPVPM